jgi:glycosyltransferase involved in cell wall biosynthesis
MAARKHLNRPLIAHVHATEFDRAGGTNGNPLVHEIELQGLMMADRIVAVSGATKQLIIDRYQIPGDKIEVVYNSIDTSEYGPVDDADSYAYLNHMKAQGYQVVVSISRLTIMKGLRFYLEAAQLALQANPKLIFVVAGNGELYHELIEISAELSIAEQVVFTGFVRGKPWRDLYAVADMFVMPSVSEPFGLTALEAVGYGSAALVSKQSGVGEILNHVLKFDFWDTHRLASQIVALSYQPSLAQELRDNSWREFSQLSWQQAARHCQRLYQQVAGATS